MAASKCLSGSHQPVQDWEYRVVYFMPFANEPRWVAEYHSALDTALDVKTEREAREDITDVRIEEGRWVEVGQS